MNYIGKAWSDPKMGNASGRGIVMDSRGIGLAIIFGLVLAVAIEPFRGYFELAILTSARRRFPHFVGCSVGASFGAIVSPWALGLYSFYFLSPWGVAPGMLGLVLVLIHGAPGFKIAVTLELIPRGVVSEMISQVIIESINGLFWALVYGLVGLAIDKLWKRRLSR